MVSVKATIVGHVASLKTNGAAPDEDHDQHHHQQHRSVFPFKTVLQLPSAPPLQSRQTMKAEKRGKWFKKMQKSMKAKQHKRLVLEAVKVVGEWAKARVCIRWGLDAEWKREMYLLIVE